MYISETGTVSSFQWAMRFIGPLSWASRNWAAPLPIGDSQSEATLHYQRCQLATYLHHSVRHMVSSRRRMAFFNHFVETFFQIVTVT